MTSVARTRKLFSSMSRSQSLIGWALIVLVGAPPAMAPTTAGADSCQAVAGKFAVHRIDPSGCSSPVGLCYAGESHGSIQGQNLLTVTNVTLEPPDAPGMLLLIGNNVITTRFGTVHSRDFILQAQGAPGEPVDFAEVDTIVEGTGGYAGITGRVTSTGTSAGDAAEGTYFGHICRP